MEAATQNGTVGRVEEITGVVIEAVFEQENLPEIFNALETEIPSSEDGGEPTRLVVEVQQHLGDDRVRCVAMDATDGLRRGAEIRDTGGPITVPVGEGTLGRIFNLLGDQIDDAGEVKYEERWPIHRAAPTVENLTPTREIFETGIKVVDLLAPYAKGGKVGLFGGAGVGKTVLIQELIHAEGYADLVGYTAVDLPLSVTAAELAAEVRAGRLPAALPVDADFEGGSPRLSQAYQGAWLAVRMLDERHGRAALLRFYRAVGARRGVPAATAVEDALQAELGTTTAAVTADWRAWLQRRLA